MIASHTIGDFPGNTVVHVKRNGAPWNDYASNSTGYINFTHSGYPEVQFEARALTPEVVAYDGNNDGIIQKTEAVRAVADYFTGIITKSEAIAVISAYFSAG